MARFKKLVETAKQKLLAGKKTQDQITNYISTSLDKVANQLTDTHTKSAEVQKLDMCEILY